MSFNTGTTIIFPVINIQLKYPLKNTWKVEYSEANFNFHIYCEILNITAEILKCNSFFENKSDAVCTNTQNYIEMI